MQIDELQKILTKTMWNQSVLLLVLLAIGVCTLIFYIVYYSITRSNSAFSFLMFLPTSRKRKTKKTLKQQIAELSIGLIVVLGLTVWLSYPMYKDIKYQQIEEVHTRYIREEISSEGNFFSNGTAYIEINGEQVLVELPYGWDADSFPLGEYSCIAWYAKDSKVLLAIERLN